MRSFRLPRPPRTGASWYLAGVLVNALALGGLIWLSTLTPQREEIVRLIILVPPEAPREVSMAYVELDDAVDGGGDVPLVFVPPRPSDETSELPADRDVDLSIPPEVIAFPTRSPDVLDLITPPDSVLGPVLLGTRRVMGPSFGDGRFWSPVELTPVERAVISISVAQIDSLLRERIIARIRELPPDSFALATGGSWITQIGGQTVGIDQQFIYLGPIKVPTALLALLPLNLPEGDIFAAREKREYERIRREIIDQAQRQADMQDVRRYIEEMRERIDQQRATDRSVVTPDSLKSPRDTVIPR